MQNESLEPSEVVGQGAPSEPANPVSPANPADPFELTIQRLKAQMTVREFTFPSSTPVVGGVISALRRLWGNVAARWLLRHYALHQLEYQTTLLHLLQLLQQQNQHLREQVSVQAQHIGHLQAQASIQAQHIAESTAQIRAFQEKVPGGLAHLAEGLVSDRAREAARTKQHERDIMMLSQIVLKPEPVPDPPTH